MIGKKETNFIFEQYRQVLKEQVEDNSINALLNAIKKSNLDEKVRNSLVSLLKDPEVVSKWGDMDRVNEPSKSPYDRYDMPAVDNRSGADFLGKEKEVAKNYYDLNGNLASSEEEEGEKPRKYDYKTGRYEGETDEQRYDRMKRDSKVLGSFSK
jgi:hypothetical protein